MKIFENKSLLEYNTFHIEAIADRLVIFDDENEIRNYLKSDHKELFKRLVIGEGSNLLFTDQFRGEILKIENKGFVITHETQSHVWVKAAAGESWDYLVEWCVKQGFGGIENLSYIPGTVGAAPVQNIGAYGVEFCEVFNSLEAIELKSGEKKNFYLQELLFDYRYSVFKGKLKDQFIITSVIIKLQKQPELKLEYGQIKKELAEISSPTIKDVREAIIKIRKSKLPDPKETGNAGSFFKNPVVNSSEFQRLIKEFPEIAYYSLENEQYKLAAAWLIEKAGLKGFSLGESGTHPNHALILINKGQAKGEEILKLSQHIQKKVYEKFSVSLEPEVLIL